MLYANKVGIFLRLKEGINLNMRRKILTVSLLSIALVLCCCLVATAWTAYATGSDSGATTEETGTESTEWTSADFTYGDYSKDLYGCDYSREITISGKVVTGFSDSGLTKLESNKDLVIPRQDDAGNILVGVGEGAFAEKGLTSVTFQTGCLVDYNDTVTNRITKRGNFIIAESAFKKNNLKQVELPEGVIAVLSNAFFMNQLEYVSLPKTIWWIENQSFAKNLISRVDFPTTCDFQLEMHGLSFANNLIKSVRLPNFTEVVNKNVFAWNTGMEPVSETLSDNLKTYTAQDGKQYASGIVYMYTDNAELEIKERIHTTDRKTASQRSDFQKLIVNDGTEETENPNQIWTTDDFTWGKTEDGTGAIVTGFTDAGKEKIKTESHLVIPDTDADGLFVREIGAAVAGGNGLFGAEGVVIDSVYLPESLKKIGNLAFQNSNIKEVTFPYALEKIGSAAFQTNNLTSVVLPDTLTTLGNGAFATNPNLHTIRLSSALTEIPDAAFGCSDAKNYMTNLRELELHDGITSIGRNAFAGNNITNIKIPSTVTSIGNYAFSTKNYLTDECTVELNEGLATIGNAVFRNKVIKEVKLPSTVTSIHKNAFQKEYSDGTTPVKTQIYVSDYEKQYSDSTNFPRNEYMTILYTGSDHYTAEDFNYAEQEFCMWPADEYSTTKNFTQWCVTGLNDNGKAKVSSNTVLEIPSTDSDGKQVTGIADNAFKNLSLTSIKIPENVKTAWDGTTWSVGTDVTERGNFFIGASAFLGNNFESLAIPEGVIYVGGSAFQKCGIRTLKLPSTIMQVSNASFARNEISLLDLPESTTFPTNFDSQCFAINKITSCQIPNNTEKMHKWAFIQNTGMETVTAEGATAAEKKGGVVWLYATATDKFGSHVDYGNVSKLVTGALPDTYKPWEASDFTYSETGETITGLSDAGKAKLVVNPNIVLPAKGSTDVVITALGDGASQQGIFVYEDTENSKSYTPQSVILPDTLTKIGKFTFAIDGTKTYEYEMSTISFPNSLIEIGQTAFQNNKLTSLVIPDSVTTIGAGAFTGWSKLTSVKLSASCVDIPASMLVAATEHTTFSSLAIPEGVKTIGRMAFSGCAIESLSLPSTLTSIGASAFMNHQLENLEIPGSVTEIGSTAFRISQESLVKKLTDLKLNEGLVTIGQNAFQGNALVEVELPSTVVLSAQNKAADCIFGNKTAPANPIVKLKTSDKTKLDFNTEFANQYSHIVEYDKLAGSGWTSDDFTYSEENASITGWSESGKEKHKTLHNLVLPDTTPEGVAITAISNAAFSLEEEAEPNKMGGYDSPYGLTSVDLPESLTSIGAKAFAFNSFETFDLTGLTSIGEEAFKGNKLKSAHIPDTVTSLGKGAFTANLITDVTLPQGLTVIPQGLFSSNTDLSTVTIPDTVTEIGEEAFGGDRITSLTIPSSVTTIGKKAFHLHRLTTLTIPGNVKTIGESAFEGTYKATTLKTLILEEGIETIGDTAFKEGLLQTIELPESITSLGVKTFANNTGKDDTGVVECISTNPEQLKFVDETYKVVEKATETEVKVNITDSSSSGTGQGTSTVLVNGIAFDAATTKVKEGDTVSVKVSSGATASTSATTGTSTNLSMYKSATINGEALSGAYDKSSWTQTNSEYEARMGEKATEVSFDKVKASLETGFTTGTYTVKATDTSLDINVAYEEVSPVYRLYNMISSEHLFTTDKAEYDRWVEICKARTDYWIGEGIDWFAPVGGKQVYRLYNAGLGLMSHSSHYYTSDEAEVQNLTANYGWTAEAASFGYMSGGDVAIYTCYNEALGSAHHYTSSKSEWEGLAVHGWNLETDKNNNGTGFFKCFIAAK